MKTIYVEGVESTLHDAKELSARLQNLGFNSSYEKQEMGREVADKAREADVIVCVLCGCCPNGMELLSKHAFDHNRSFWQKKFKPTPVVIVRVDSGINNYYIRGSLCTKCSDDALIDSINEALSMTDED